MHVSDAGWEICRRTLSASHAFAKPIEILPERLSRTVTCAYALCRLADNLEDDYRIPGRRRSELLQRFVGALEGGDPEIPEAEGLPLVLSCLATLPESHREICVRWISELARGMAIYGRRDSITSIPDLERYCYFAAGTVGHLLTDLFLEETPGLDRERMHELGETYGLALQFVNTLRDIPADIEHGFSFIPRTVAPDPRRVLDRPELLNPLFARAKQLLEIALGFGLAMADPRIRMSCLIPLWLAVPTLRRFETNLRASRLDRNEAAGLMKDLQDRCASEERLREGFRILMDSRLPPKDV